MSKIRIYELAKELGVENKVVVTLAQQVGVPGKLSHSNSLEADEADQIRRAVIRQAIGTTPESSVVTTRVNKATGEANTVVESRKGNVIRRRKRDAADEVHQTEATGSELEAQGGAENVDGALARDQEQLEAQAAADLDTHGLPQAEALDSATAEQASEAESAVEQPSGEEAKKPGVGPRVLGKIALPQKRVVKPAAKKSVPTTGAPVAAATEEESEEEGEKGRGEKRKKTKKREVSRLELVDYEGRGATLRRGPRGGKAVKGRQAERSIDAQPVKVGKRALKIASDSISVGEMAKQMSIKVGELIAKLMQNGIMATINHAIDVDTATIVAEEMGFEVERTGFDETKILQRTVEDAAESLKPRPPVVTVMGHVDHGKTTLLDTIRHAAVAAKEHGGITQHIGAYSVALEDGRSITFIDTPGHSAFTSMRARGAQVTDVVVLVVAADDGVMPQTIEAINHAKAAGVQIIVAINKIDKGGANIDRLKKQLSEHGLAPEEWGGDTLYFPVSALKGTGIKELLEGILLVVEIKDLKANPERRARGTVVEARQDKGRGAVATILVQNGTLHVGDVFVSGAEFGRIRSMSGSAGERVEKAGPSAPVEVTGLSGVPFAGDDFFVVESEADARQVASERARVKQAKEQRSASGPISLEEFSKRASNMGALTLNVILKTDVHGSLEAARMAIEQLSTEKVRVRVIHAAVGGVNESDIQLAIASQALIVAFGVRAEARAAVQAEQAGIEIRYYRIIYEMIDDVKNAMAGLLAPIKKEIPLGRVEIRETFNIPKLGTIAGCFVVNGLVKRSGHVRLLRDNKVIYEGRIGTLRRFKDDAREVQSGYECGLSIEGYNDIKIGDELEVFDVQEVAATL